MIFTDLLRVGADVAEHTAASVETAMVNGDYLTAVRERVRIGKLAEIVASLSDALKTSHNLLRDHERLLLAEQINV